MYPTFSGLIGAREDDPLLTVDARRRLSLGKLAAHRRYVATFDDGGGQILLSPCKVLMVNDNLPPEQDPSVPLLTGQWNYEIQQHQPGPVPLIEVDRRSRISLGWLARQYGMTLNERYLATVQPTTSQILLTPATILPAHLELLFEQNRGERRVTQQSWRPGEAAGTSRNALQ